MRHWGTCVTGMGGEFAFLKISLTRELMVTNIWTVRWIRTVFRGR